MKSTLMCCDQCHYEEEIPRCGQERPDSRAWVEIVATLKQPIPDLPTPWHFCTVGCAIKRMTEMLHGQAEAISAATD